MSINFVKIKNNIIDFCQQNQRYLLIGLACFAALLTAYFILAGITYAKLKNRHYIGYSDGDNDNEFIITLPQAKFC